MRIIVVAATKGGVGKTTLTASLAVAATRDGENVAMVDLDGQRSLSRWWHDRDRDGSPELYEAKHTGELPALIEYIGQEGHSLVFIDTPPGGIDIAEAAVRHASLVLTPLKASRLDTDAIRPVIDLARQAHVSLAVVLNEAPSGKAAPELIESVLGYLRRANGDLIVLDKVVHDRQSHVAAVSQGLAAVEMPEADPTAGKEIDALWQAIKKLVAPAKRGPKRLVKRSA